MKEKGLLFKGDMIKQIIAGNKTQTRRIIKPQPVAELWEDEYRGENIEPLIYDPLIKGMPDLGIGCYSLIDNLHKSPYGKIGDLLYVKEAYEHTGAYFIYKANEKGDFWLDEDYEETREKIKWKSPLFMPKAAARIWLQIEDIKVERLQEISEEDAVKEGIAPLFSQDEINNPHYRSELDLKPMPYKNYLYPKTEPYSSCETGKESFATLWKSINGEESWNNNPFVWVIEFMGMPVTYC